MRVLAVVPARGGSVGVPLKNLAQVGGTPLVARAVRRLPARRADRRGRGQHRPRGDRRGRRGGGRRAWSSGPPSCAAPPPPASRRCCTRSTRSAGRRRPRWSSWCSAPARSSTPPTSTPRSRKVLDGDADVVFSGAADARVPVAERRRRPGVNHDPAHRPRRQDREPQYRETGAFYVMRTDGLARARAPVLRPGRACSRCRRGTRSRSTTPEDLEMARGARRRSWTQPRADRRRRGGHRLRRRAHRRPRLRRPGRPRDGARSAAPTAWASPCCARAGVKRADPVDRAEPGGAPRGRASSACRCCRASTEKRTVLRDWLADRGPGPGPRRLRRQRRQRPGRRWRGRLAGRGARRRTRGCAPPPASC